MPWEEKCQNQNRNPKPKQKQGWKREQKGLTLQGRGVWGRDSFFPSQSPMREEKGFLSQAFYPGKLGDKGNPEALILLKPGKQPEQRPGKSLWPPMLPNRI